jgi:galactokinase
MNQSLVDKTLTAFHSSFKGQPEFSVFSPGRINLIGEHTDYNNGFVLPAAVDLGIYAAFRRSPDNVSKVYAPDLDDSCTFSHDQLAPIAHGGWKNYILGVVHFLQQQGLALRPFEAVITGDIPKGAGMSSSAALENAFSYGLNQLYQGILDRITLSRVGQQAEHNFVGVKCGIMDQYSSMLGRAHHVMLLDCQSLEVEQIPIELKDHQLLLINSQVHHNLASSEYNVRRAQCEEGVKKVQSRNPEVRSLRDVHHRMLSDVQGDLSEVVLRRCRYVLEENQRVLDFTVALKNNDLISAGQLLKEGQHGMRHDYADHLC